MRACNLSAYLALYIACICFISVFTLCTMDISSGNMSKTSFVVLYYPNPQHGIHVILTCCVHLQEQKRELLVYTFEQSEFYDHNIMQKVSDFSNLKSHFIEHGT